MPYHADIAVYGKDERLQLLVETKSKRSTSQDWAAKMRRNMYAHGLLPEAQFFLLALPDKFYLWKNIGLSTEIVNSSYEISSESFLQPYYTKAGVSLSEITGRSFELIVSAWLREVMGLQSADSLPQDYRDWFVSSGLFDAIQGGRLESEVLV
ncbi:MAG TPA: hypothetical protein V6D33_07020 [Cyanophyceae cyanobacterium]